MKYIKRFNESVKIQKKCKRCQLDKDIEDFGLYSRAKDGFRAICKTCHKEVMKSCNMDKEKRKASNRKYSNKRAKLPETKEKRRIYIENNRELINRSKNNWIANKKLNDPLFKFNLSIRKIIKRSIVNAGYTKSSKTNDILGCSTLEFRKYLESKFEPWMNWDNKGLYNGEFNYGWDIDHIIPLSSAETEDDIIKLNHYTNLQPLCSKINRDIKRDTLPY